VSNLSTPSSSIWQPSGLTPGSSSVGRQTPMSRRGLVPSVAYPPRLPMPSPNALAHRRSVQLGQVVNSHGLST
jgi:hypothetical protein